MKMKQNRNDTAFADTYFRKFVLPKFRLGPALVSVLAFIISCGVIIWGSARSGIADTGRYAEFELGRVADRDIIAEHAVSYVDEEATRLRLEAEEGLVPAVFVFSQEVGDQCRSAFYRFVELSRNLFSQRSSAEAYKLAIQAELPGAFSSDTLDALFRDPGRDRLLDYGSAALEYLLDTGIVAMPQIGLEMFNPDVAELYHNKGQQIERERVFYDRLIRYETVDAALSRHIASGAFSASFAVLAFPMLKPFITENVFFSPLETNLRVAETRARA
jgi:hypothetical protein